MRTSQIAGASQRQQQCYMLRGTPSYNRIVQQQRRFSQKCSCSARIPMQQHSKGASGCKGSIVSPYAAFPRTNLLQKAMPGQNAVFHSSEPRSAVITVATTSSDAAQPCSGRAVVVGGGPTGLAAAIGLAKQAGFRVDVFDNRPDPTKDTQASHEALLVALGARGLQALSDLDISLTQGSPGHTPGYSSATEKSEKVPTGLTLLQGMVMQGPHGKKRVEVYGGKHQHQGIAVMDSYALTTHLLAEAEAAAVRTSTPPAPAVAAAGVTTSIPATLQADSYTTITFDAAAAAAGKPQQQTPLTAAGPAAAASAEEAQAATLPPVIQAGQTGQSLTGGVEGKDVHAGVKCHYSCELLMVDTANKQATFIGPSGDAMVVPYDILIGAEYESGAHLVAETLSELHQRQYAHKHPGLTSTAAANAAAANAAAAMPDKAMAAAAAAVDQAAKQAAGVGATQAAAKAAAFVELEYKCWHDMPHQGELKAMLPAKYQSVKDSLDELGQSHQQSPGRGWLLIWTGTAGTGKAQPFPSSPDSQQDTPTRSNKASWTVSGTPGGGSTVVQQTPGSDSVVLPGGPTCTLMAWPSRSGGSWSGAVFTAPQVFESLRSQGDYEGLLRGLRTSEGAVLPGLWIKGIASELKARADRVGRVMAPFLLPPPHIAAPSAGVALLGPAACLTGSPQLLCPTVSLGLQDAAVLAAAVAGAVGRHQTDDLAKRVEQALKHYDSMRQPQVAALQKLQAQLSYLRHPFSPAATAALAAVPICTLAWWTGLVGRARAGLALEWRCLASVLPLVAAVFKAFGIGHAGHHTASKAVMMNSDAKVENASAVAAAAATAVGIHNVLDNIQPSGASFMAFLHTTALPFTGVWHLLHLAPALWSILVGFGVWAAAEAVKWGVWLWKVWGISWAGA